MTGWRVDAPLPHWAPVRLLGGVLFVAGLAVLIHAFVRFVVEGPEPPHRSRPPKLVVGGLYRHVRNPMYVAILAGIAGQALLLGQLVLLAYAATAWLVAAAFVHWYEEPTLRRQFGSQYETYKRNVPGWWPRVRPWRPTSTD